MLLWVSGALKAHRHDKVETPSVGRSDVFAFITVNWHVIVNVVMIGACFHHQLSDYVSMKYAVSRDQIKIQHKASYFF
jgi:hypothetical protein